MALPLLSFIPQRSPLLPCDKLPSQRLGGATRDVLVLSRGRAWHLLSNCRFDFRSRFSRDLFAKPIKTGCDTVPDVASLSGNLSGAFSKTSEVGNVPLRRLAFDALALNEDGTPMNIVLGVRTKLRPISQA